MLYSVAMKTYLKIYQPIYPSGLILLLMSKPAMNILEVIWLLST
jgi:hypothetical protein